MRHTSCILLFLRSPRPGEVKTRLACNLGHNAALGLYKAFLPDMLDALHGCGADLALWVAPGREQDLDMVRGWLGDGFPLLPQPEGDLGRRMDHAFRWAFEQGYMSAAALGSDLPGLTPRLARSLARLSRSEPALIGPSPDGGYWTIGFQAGAYVPAVFEGIPWSTPEVYAKTMDVLAALQPAVLPELRDMDTVEDLLALAGACPEGTAVRTLAEIRRLELAKVRGEQEASGVQRDESL